MLRPSVISQLCRPRTNPNLITKYALTSQASPKSPQPQPQPPKASRPFSSQTPTLSKNQLPPRLKIDEADTTIAYLKGTGPGGQKINKTNSAVQIIHKPTGVVIKCQETRSRSQNEKIGRQILADRVEAVLRGDHSRVAIKADRARKKKASKMKKSRRKYRELEEEGGRKGENEDVDVDENENEDEEDEGEGERGVKREEEQEQPGQQQHEQPPR